MTELLFQRLRDDAIVPAQAYAGDAGLDLAACEAVQIAPGERALVPTGLAVAIVDSIAPVRSFAAKHVVHIIFSGDLEGRSLEKVTSKDAAVRGHRLFEVGELDEIVLHPPIQHFLSRWVPGDPVVYLGPLWAP